MPNNQPARCPYCNRSGRVPVHDDPMLDELSCGATMPCPDCGGTGHAPISKREAMLQYRFAWAKWKRATTREEQEIYEVEMDRLQPFIARGPGPEWKAFAASLSGFLEFWEGLAHVVADHVPGEPLSAPAAEDYRRFETEWDPYRQFVEELDPDANEQR